jgi:hypothetical protein
MPIRKDEASNAPGANVSGWLMKRQIEAAARLSAPAAAQASQFNLMVFPLTVNCQQDDRIASSFRHRQPGIDATLISSH